MAVGGQVSRAAVRVPVRGRAAVRAGDRRLRAGLLLPHVRVLDLHGAAQRGPAAATCRGLAGRAQAGRVSHHSVTVADALASTVHRALAYRIPSNLQ